MIFQLVCSKILSVWWPSLTDAYKAESRGGSRARGVTQPDLVEQRDRDLRGYH